MKVACSVSSLRQRCSHGLIDDYALVFLWNLPQMCCAKRRFSDGRSGATTRRAELTSMTTNPIKHSDSTNTAVGPIRCTVNTGGGPLGARGAQRRVDGREGCAPAPARRLSPAAKSCHSPPAAARGALSARKGRFDVPKGRARPAGRGQPLARRERAHGLCAEAQRAVASVPSARRSPWPPSTSACESTAAVVSVRVATATAQTPVGRRQACEQPDRDEQPAPALAPSEKGRRQRRRGRVARTGPRRCCRPAPSSAAGRAPPRMSRTCSATWYKPGAAALRRRQDAGFVASPRGGHELSAPCQRLRKF